jgi:phospholipid/cholesterol/gamma-HCH transport system ATP-binding protein
VLCLIRVSIYNPGMTFLARPAPQRRMVTLVPGEPLISFKDVHIGFDQGEVLGGISFEVWPAETKILLGENGSGKTLIMKMAAGLLRADAGRIWVMGQDLGAMSETDLLDFRRHIGFVFQEGALFDSLTVAENVAFRLREENIEDAEIETRVREGLRFVEMEEAIQKYPSELSGGMRRRVAIARAVVDRPPVVFYDSPTAGLDPVTSQTIITLILRGRDLQGMTAMLATDRVQDAFGLARFRFDKKTGHVQPVGRTGHSPEPRENNGEGAGAPPTSLLVLRDGQVYFEGTTEQFLHSADAYLKTFLASAE